MNYRGREIEWRELPGGGLILVRVPNEREQRCIDRYKRGDTSATIAASEGVSRQRIQQLLARYGITRLDGGQRHRWPLRLAAAMDKRAARHERCMAKWGISLAEHKAITAKYGKTHESRSPFCKFIQQRKNARQRNIEWRITFREWWTIWQDSGRWEQRGRGQGYCMARKLDQGPYAPENVYICTIGENFSDSYLVDHPRRKASARLLATSDPIRWAA